MNAERAVFALLAADSTLASLVSTRIYPSQAKQDTDVPYVVYRQVGDETQQAKLRGVADVTIVDIQVEIYATTNAEVDAIKSAVVACLNGHRDIDFQGIFKSSTSTDDDSGYANVTQNFRAFYVED